jgi:hypothetical protein
MPNKNVNNTLLFRITTKIGPGCEAVGVCIVDTVQ